MSVLSSADAAPPRQALQVYEHLAEVGRRELARLEALIETDVAARELGGLRDADQDDKSDRPPRRGTPRDSRDPDRRAGGAGLRGTSGGARRAARLGMGHDDQAPGGTAPPTGTVQVPAPERVEAAIREGGSPPVAAPPHSPGTRRRPARRFPRPTPPRSPGSSGSSWPAWTGWSRSRSAWGGAPSPSGSSPMSRPPSSSSPRASPEAGSGPSPSCWTSWRSQGSRRPRSNPGRARGRRRSPTSGRLTLVMTVPRAPPTRSSEPVGPERTYVRRESRASGSPRLATGARTVTESLRP